MDNLFDSDNYPDKVPNELYSESFWGWKRSDITEAYPPASYTLKFKLSRLDDQTETLTITAAEVDGEHVVQHQDTGTDITAGDCQWQAVVARDSDSAEIVVDSGVLEILDRTGDTAADTSSWVYRTLIAIRAVITSSATKEQESVSINGRSLKYRSLSELMELEREFSDRWRQEKKAKGGPTKPNRTLIGMSA